MIPLHLGALHPVEQWLTLLLAFGPFVVLGLVIWRQRHREDQPGDAAGPEQAQDSGDRSPTERTDQRER